MANASNVRRVIQEARVLLGIPEHVPASLCNLQYHPRNKRVCFRRVVTHTSDITGKRIGHKTFLVDKNLHYDGITKPMKQTFWTSYAAPAVKDQVKGKKAGARTTSGCFHGGSGKLHGTKVHEGLEWLIRVIREPLKKKDGTPVVPMVDPCSYRILCALVKRRIVPIFSEFVIFDEYSGLATAIDCIGWDISLGHLVAIEVKTGHVGQTNYSSVSGNAHFRPPMEIVPDSALNRAATQLMLSTLILARRYDIQVDRGIIIRPMSGHNNVQIYKMPAWTHLPEMQQNMYAQLRTFVTSGVNARRIMKRTANGARQRAAVGQQEVKQTVREAQEDPAYDVFWVPKPDVDWVETGPTVKRPRPETPPPPPPENCVAVILPEAPEFDETELGPSRARNSWSVPKAPGLPCMLSKSDLSWRSEVARAPPAKRRTMMQL